MGWFWADPQVRQPPASFKHPHISGATNGAVSPPPGCPMHQKTADALNPHSKHAPPTTTATSPSCSKSTACSSSSSSSSSLSACPVPHGTAASSPHESSSSTLSKLNPLNYMPHSISQSPSPNQTQALPTTREPSTIPKGSGDGNWEYPSPQQMYNALLRKGYTDTDVTAVESMVSVHNFLNEGAWGEILEWEKRFSGGLYRGWRICRKGEAHVEELEREVNEEDGRMGLLPQGQADEGPRLIRFQGRPKEMTPKAALIQFMGKVYPSMFATEPPFDRHDWYVARPTAPTASNPTPAPTEVRYVIDYYSGPPEPTGEPVFYLDVRPAMTLTGASERMLRWGCDLWWRATGGEVREEARRGTAGTVGLGR